MEKSWTNFTLTLHGLTQEQYFEVEDQLEKFQQEMEKRFDVDGGDFIGIESGTIKS